MEELLLESLPLFKELDVIDEEHVDLAVPALERGVGLVPNRVDEFVEEPFGRHVPDIVVLIVVVDVVTDGVEQMGLPESS